MDTLHEIKDTETVASTDTDWNCRGPDDAVLMKAMWECDHCTRRNTCPYAKMTLTEVFNAKLSRGKEKARHSLTGARNNWRTYLYNVWLTASVIVLFYILIKSGFKLTPEFALPLLVSGAPLVKPETG